MMRSLIKIIWRELDRDDINWELEYVAFEFLAIACLAYGITENGWDIQCSTLPPEIRMDSWCRFPTHSYGRFGRRTRHCKIQELAGVLTPRFIIDGPSDQFFSIYYQGFPPIEVSGERPDWVIIPAKANISCENNEVSLKLDGKSGIWEGRFGTLLGPFGPLIRSESGNISLPCGIIEVSLSKDTKHLNKQVYRYKKIYGDIKYIGFLGCEVLDVKFPIITVPPGLQNGLTYDICFNAGKQLFKLLFTNNFKLSV